MRRIIILFFVLGTLAFGKWETVELVDEFKEKTGTVSAYSLFVGRGFIRLDKYDNQYSFTITTGEYIGGKGKYDESLVKIKIDKNKPISINGYVSKGGKQVYVDISKVLIDQMKLGKRMKLVVTKYNDTTVFRDVSLDNFDKVFDKVKQ